METDCRSVALYVTEYLSQLIASVNLNKRLDILMKIYYLIIEYSVAAQYSEATEYEYGSVFGDDIRLFTSIGCSRIFGKN